MTIHPLLIGLKRPLRNLQLESIVIQWLGEISLNALTNNQLESQNKAKQPDETFSIKTAKKLDKKVRQGYNRIAENTWYDWMLIR